VYLSGLWRIALLPLATNYLQQDIKSTGFIVSLGFGLWNPGDRAR
jgi:hypothetical protein